MWGRRTEVRGVCLVSCWGTQRGMREEEREREIRHERAHEEEGERVAKREKRGCGHAYDWLVPQLSRKVCGVASFALVPPVLSA